MSDELLKRVFIYSFLGGIVAHGSVMANTLFWHDGLRCAYSVKVTSAVRLGRWMRAFLAKIVAGMFGGTNPSLPWLYGIVSIFFIAASAYLIICMFKIEQKLLQLILCGMMVSFPAVTSTFGYMYTAPYYFLGLFLSTLAVFVAREWAGAKGFLGGIICLCCSLGIYQAYIAVTMSLLVMLLVFDIVNDRFDTLPRFFGRAFYYLGVLIVGFAVYYVIWKLCLRAMNLAVMDYQGLTSFGSQGLGVYLEGIRTAYGKFFLIDMKARENLYPMGLRTAQIIVIALSILFSVYLIVRKLGKNVLFGIVLALLIALLPLCFNSMFYIGAKSVHTVMLYGQCMLYVYLICAVAHVLQDGVRIGMHGYRLAALVLIVFVGMNIFFDNGCYMKAEMLLQQSISNMTVLVSRIKALDGYSDDMRICIAPLGERDATVRGDTKLPDYLIMPWNKILPYNKTLSISNMKVILSEWCGFSPKYISYDRFDHKDIVEQMPNYPDAGSVQIVDGTVVVRM